MSVAPKELVEVARQAARDELADAEEAWIRQQAGHVGAVVCQAVWDALDSLGIK